MYNATRTERRPPQYHSLTSQRTQVPVQRGDAGKRSDLLPVQLPELGELSDQRA